MKNLGFYHSTFVRQTNANNCGMACICMILRYSGRDRDADELAERLDSYEFELSLLDLKNMVANFGYQARCVEMDMATLRALKNPFVMHTVNEDGIFHFLVLIAVKKMAEGFLYVVGDPSHGIKIMNEFDLRNTWVSSSGLFIENLTLQKSGNDLLYWKNALEWQIIPKPLWYSIPIVNLMSFLFGIALSAFLQQLLTGSANIRSLKLQIAVLVLLLIIILCKSLFTYLKQRLLICINKIINIWLATRLTHNITMNIREKSQKQSALRKRLLDIAKFQLSVNGLISIILSDGLVLLTLLGAAFYLDLYAALINIGYIAVAVSCAVIRMPDHLFSAMYMNDLYHRSEKILLNTKLISGTYATASDNDDFTACYQDYIHHAGKSGVIISTWLFRNEVYSGFAVILILGFEMALGRESVALLITVTVISYLITIFLQRINSAFPVVYEGIQAARSLKL